MTSAPISLERGPFERSFPFAFVVSQEGAFECVGEKLRRHVDVIATTADGAFQVLRPRGSTSFIEAARSNTPMIEIRLRGGELRLRGHAVHVNDGQSIAFFASPLVSSLEGVQSAGLQLGDFSADDATPDLLLSMQATKTALADARVIQANLETALADAKAAILAKEQFLAVFSHEVRTPLNGIGSMIDLLLEDPTEAERQDLIETITECSSGLLRLLTDVLDMSQIGAGEFALAEQPFDLCRLVGAVTQDLHQAAEQSGLTLELHCSPALPSVLVGDPDRVRSVCRQLIGNAIKFTDSGGVRVEVRGAAKEGVRIQVHDSGCGVPDFDREKIFDPFFQIDSSTTRVHGGTGLGLSLCRAIARRMGGDIVLLESGARGSLFEFSFQAARGAEAPAGTASKAPCSEAPAPSQPSNENQIQGMEVLVVDDVATNRLVARRLLERMGARVTEAEDGEAAVMAAGKERFDVVLMDLMMPRVDGFEATRRIRCLPVAWCDMPIIAFSGATQVEYRERASALGMRSFLEKPVRLESLRSALMTGTVPASGVDQAL